MHIGGMKFDTHTVLSRDKVLISLFLCLYFFKCCFAPEIHETTKIWHPREQNYLFGHFSYKSNISRGWAKILVMSFFLIFLPPSCYNYIFFSDWIDVKVAQKLF